MNMSEDGNKLDLRVGASIYPSQYHAIKNILSELMERCPAQFILLADSSGLYIMSFGEKGQMDMTTLSSLIAGDLAASREIAQITGEYKNQQLILREGQQTSTFISEAGEHLIIFVQISANVPIGWARILIRQTSLQIAKIISTQPELIEKLDLGLKDTNLSDAVGDALGSLWLG